MEYTLNIEKAKAVAVCRICKKKINIGEIRIRTIISDDYYGDKSMCLHTNCALSFIIKEVEKIKLEDLKKEMEKFNSIKKILEGGKK